MYDVYLQQRDRSTIVPDRTAHKQIWRIIGNPGVVLQDGEIVATWRPSKKGKRLGLSVERLGQAAPLDRAEIEAEAAQVAACRGAELSGVTFSGA
jgi:hypothetical protein